MKKIKKIITIAIVCANGTVIYNVFSPKKAESTQAYKKYESFKPVNLSGVPEEEIFSEEVDCVYVDRLGIKNVTFKQDYLKLN